jgi:asparagine synthase (glutamine-hydrolysing)
MSAIFGIIDKTGGKPDPVWIEKIRSELDRPAADRSAVIQKDQAHLGVIQIFNTPESITEVLPYEDPITGLVIISDCRIDNRNALNPLLDPEQIDQTQIPDSRFLMKAFRKWETDCCEKLRGDFAFGVYDISQHRLFLARDHFGMRPLYYYDHPRYFTFSSEMRGILAVPYYYPEPNEPWIQDYLLNTDREEYDTFYLGIHALPPGHYLELVHGKLEIRSYWELTMPEPIGWKDDRDIIDMYKSLFCQSIKNRIRTVYPVGAELSGGLDSSSIVSVAARQLKINNQPLHIFSRVLPDGIQGSNGFRMEDETHEIRTVFDFIKYGHLHFVSMSGQSVSENISKSIEIIRAPYNSNYATYNFNNIDIAQQNGVRTILSGHGGDQMVTHPALFVYSNYLKNRRYVTLLNDLRAHGQPQQISWLQALVLMRDVHKSGSGSGMKRGELKKIFRFGIHPDFLNKHNLKEYYLGKRASVLLFPDSADDLIGKIRSRNLYNRIEVSSLIAGHFRVEYRYPMFDVDLINFYLATPDHLKRRFRYGRYIHRMAMSDELPPAIQWRRDKHGSINPGLPLIFQSDASNIQAFVKDILFRNNDPLIMHFNPEILQRIIDMNAAELFEHKSVINKILQIHFLKK